MRTDTPQSGVSALWRGKMRFCINERSDFLSLFTIAQRKSSAEIKDGQL